MVSNFERLSMTLGNNANLDDNLLMTNAGAVRASMDGNNFNPISTLNYVEKYKELEDILGSEKKTNEEIKKVYRVLKADHAKIKGENLDLKSQLNNLIEENKIMQEKYKAMFDKMQQESRRKQLIIEELKNRELDEVKLERLREELSHQIETPYKDILKQLEQELQKLQQDCNKLRFENNFLKTSSEHDKTEQLRLLEQIKLKNEVELNTIRKDRDMLRQKIQESNQDDMNKMKEVIRDNNQLRIKSKALIEENEELRQKIDHLETHNNSLIRNHSKAVTEYTTKVSVLESEKESLKQQAENAHKESLNLNQSLADYVRKLHDLERENTKLKLSMDEVQHNSKRDVANFKLEMVKERGEHNRAKELLQKKIDELNNKLDIAHASIEVQKKLLEEKERELTKTMNSVNDDNWSKINELTNEKLESESKFQMIIKDFEFKLSALQLEKDKSDDRLRGYEKQREEIVRENNHLRAMAAESDNLRAEIEREQEKNRDLYRKCHKLETELASNSTLEQELTDLNMRLKNELSLNTQEIQKSKEQIHRLKDDYESKFSELKSKHIVETNECQTKCDLLQSKLNQALKKISDVEKMHEKKKKQYAAYSKTLKVKSEALNAKLKELKLKEQNMKQMVPIEAYNKLKFQLKNIGKRHEAFRDVLLSNGNFASAPLSAPPSNVNVLSGLNSIPLVKDLGFGPSTVTSSKNFVSFQNHLPISNSSLINPGVDTNYNLGFDPLVQEAKTDSNKLSRQFDEIATRMDQLAHEQKLNLKPTLVETQAEKPNLADELSMIENSIRQSRSRMTDPDRKKSSTSILEEPQTSAQQYRFTSTINKSSGSRSPIAKLNLSSSSSSSDTSKRFSPDKKSPAKSPARQSSLTSLGQQGGSIREHLSTDKSKEAKFFSPIKAADKGRESSYDEDFEESIKSNLQSNNDDSDQD